MEATLALTGALLFGVASGGVSSGALYATIVRDGHWSRLLRGPIFFLFYILGGLAVMPLLGVFQDLWQSLGVLSVPGGMSSLYLAIALWSAAATLAVGVLLKFPLSPWHILLASHVGVGIAAYWGFVHIDRFGGHFLTAVVLGPLIAYLIAVAIRYVIAQAATATNLYIYADAKPLTLVPRGDNPLTSMMAMHSASTLGRGDLVGTDLREQTDYRSNASGTPLPRLVEGLRDVGLALHLCMRGLWDIGVVALVMSVSLPLPLESVVVVAIGSVMLGVFLIRGYGSDAVVSLSGSVSKESILASQWAAALTLPLGAWFGFFFAPNQVSLGAFTGAGTMRLGGLQRLGVFVMAWIASVSMASALAAITVYLYDKVTA